MIEAAELTSGATAAGAIEAATDAQVSARQAGEPDYGAEARATQPPAPATAEKEGQLDTSPAEQAIAEVQALAEQRLSPVTFSPIGPLPDSPGLDPGDFVPRRLTGALADAEERLLDPGLSATESADLTRQVEALRARIDAIETDAGAGSVEAPAAIVDSGAASLQPPPPAQAAVLGDAIARAIATVPGRGHQLALAAARPLDDGKSAELQALARAKSGEVEEEMRTELAQMATAAGVASDQLAAKVTEQSALVAEQAGTNVAALGAAADHGIAARTAQASQEAAQISGARQAVDAEAAATQAAATGPADTATILAKRDELLGSLETAGAEVSAAYRSSLEARTRELDSAAAAQRTQIQSLADRQIAAILRHHADDPDAGGVAALETRNWVVDRSARTDAEAARFGRSAAAENRTYTAALQAQVGRSRNAVRDWAAHQEGRERSWWDRLLDAITDWGRQAGANSEQWERQRAADSRDAMAADLTALAALREAQLSGSQDELDAAMGALDADQQALAARYLQGQGVDSIGFVAESAMQRITSRRRGELTDALRDEVLRDWDWEQLGILARTKQPGFQPDQIAAQVKGAIAGPGTAEDKLFAALGTARGPVERASVEKCYLANYHVSMAEDVADDVGGSELERAQALMSGSVAEAAVATIFDAIDGPGTDEDAIRTALRGRSPAELEEIRALYRERHGIDLDAALRADLSDEELDNAQALAAGDTAAADAADLQAAMAGPGTDEEKITRVYDAIRAEVEADARRRGLSTAEMNAEIRRRNDAVAKAYRDNYHRDLSASFDEEMDYGEQTLAEALAGGDAARIDAAKALAESESAFYSSDERLEDVVRNTHRRAELEATLDLAAQRARAEELLRSGDIDAAEFQRRLDQWREDKEGLEQEIARRAGQNMADLRSEFATMAVGGDYAFEYMIRMRTSGYSEDKVLALMAGGGTLPPEEEIYYAVMGAGTDEERIQQVLRGKTPEQIQKIRAAYQARFSGRDFDDDILGDLSGREDLDTGMLLEMGDPSTFAAQLREETDPAKRAALLARMEEYLTRRKEFEQTGGIGAFLLGTGADQLNTVEQMEDAMAAARALDAALTAAGGDATDPAVLAAEQRMDMNFAGAVESQEQLRAQIDGYADIAVQVGAAIAGIAVTAATLGTAGPLVAAMYAAAASAAVGMSMNLQLRGLAYSWEQAGADAAVGAIDIAAAGLGARFARYLEPIVGQTGLMAVVSSALADGIEGVPSAMLQAGLDDRIWASEDLVGTMMATAGTAVATGAAISVGTAAGKTALGRLARPGADAPRPGRPPELDIPVEADPAVAAARAAAGQGPAGAPAQGSPGRPPHGTASEGEPASDRPIRTPGEEEIDIDTREPHVGEDGIVDLDDPRNRWLLEDRFAGMLPEDAATDAVTSRELFEGFVRSQPEIEAALLRNSETGEHIVVQGSPGSVDVRPGHGVWEGLVPPERRGSGRWDLVVHSHPVDATGTTPEYNYVPSGADGDFAWVCYPALASGQPVSQEIRLTTPDGPDLSRYGYDPAHAEPYSIDFPTAGGGREARRFGTIEDYHDWYRDRFGGELGAVPDTFPGQRRAATLTPGPDTSHTADPAAPGSAPAAPANPPVTTASGPEAGPSAIPREIVELVAARPDLLTAQGQARHRAILAAQGRSVLDFYARGQAPDGTGRALSRTADLDAEMDHLRELLAQGSATDPVAELLRLRQLQQDIGRASEVLRSRGESLWDVEVHGQTPRPTAAAAEVTARLAGKDPGALATTELLAATTVGDPIAVVATGALGEPLSRNLPGVGLERYVLRPGDLADLRTMPPGLGEALAQRLAGYQRAHLVGPGFGDELFAGIMLAPGDFNQNTQNRGIERLLRSFHAVGEEVQVTIEARGTRHAVPLAGGGVEYVDVLTEVHYDIEHPSRGELFVSFDVGPPSTISTTNIPGITVDGFAEPPPTAGGAD